MMKRYRVVLRMETSVPAEFLRGEIEYLVPAGPREQEEAEYIAREYARHFYGAVVDEVTELAQGMGAVGEHVGDTEFIPDEEYPHNPANFTCPGPGIKCVCWDIEKGSQ